MARIVNHENVGVLKKRNKGRKEEKKVEEGRRKRPWFSSYSLLLTE